MGIWSVFCTTSFLDYNSIFRSKISQLDGCQSVKCCEIECGLYDTQHAHSIISADSSIDCLEITVYLKHTFF